MANLMPHILRSIGNPKAKDFNAKEAADLCFDWLVNDFSKRNCQRPSGASHCNTKCTCLAFLQDPTYAPVCTKVSEYMVHWKGLKRDTQRLIIYKWVRVSNFVQSTDDDGILIGDNRTYMLPTLADQTPDGTDEGEEIHRVCKNAITGLLDIGRQMWTTSMVAPNISDQRKGKTDTNSSRGKANIEVYDSLNSFFNNLQEDALPFATCIIREETGLTTRDDNPDDVVLPPNVLKHSCYVQWCYSRGYIVKKKSAAKTIYEPVRNYDLREHDDGDSDDSDHISFWPQGSEVKRVVTWPTFRSYWSRKFPNLKVRKKGADTCTNCQVLVNEFRTERSERMKRAMRRRMREAASEDDTESEGSDSDDSAVSEGELQREITKAQETLQKAKEHVHAYQVQRNECRRLISLAKSDICSLLPSLFHRKVLTIDMGQNLALPNFEAEQPGDTYYFSPLTVMLFGVVYNVVKGGKDRMNAYVWQEFEGNRGANNIASCLLMDLKKQGLLNRPNYNELTYIADNCGGQNKNKVVVRFLMWLVENRIFPQVRLFFLVKGHTKNAADRMFNLLKLSYHRKNIFMYDALVECLNTNQYVDVYKMKPEHFFDHQKWQDKYYRTPSGGEFKQTHVFTIRGRPRGGKPTVLLKQDDNSAVIRRDDLLPNTRSKKAQFLPDAVRKTRIARMEEDLELLRPTPLKPIKQVELWKKWGPLLPEKDRCITCPKPSDEVILSIKDRNQEKGQERKRRKTASQTVDKK